jgi:hypothetical protein
MSNQKQVSEVRRRSSYFKTPIPMMDKKKSFLTNSNVMFFSLQDEDDKDGKENLNLVLKLVN